MAWYDLLDTQLGRLFVGGSDEGVHRINFVTTERSLDDEVHSLAVDSGESVARDPAAAAPAIEALSEWFDEGDCDFNVPLAPRGTAFQQRVWNWLLTIPSGATTSYGEIAFEIGKPGAARAVGGAVGRNPLSIVVPCHRVIASDGSLGGYASGLDRKRWMLAHEGIPVPAE